MIGVLEKVETRQAFPRPVDLSNPEVVVREVFDDDQWVKNEFANHLSKEIIEFSRQLARGFDGSKNFAAAAEVAGEKSEKAALVGVCINGILDDLLTSMKFLVAGKLSASGNLTRQAVEGVAVAMLCAAKDRIVVTTKKKKYPVDYWEHFKKSDTVGRANRALDLLGDNQDALGIDDHLIQKLKSVQKFNHHYSHPSIMALAARVALGQPGWFFVGGGFDQNKLAAYQLEIRTRTGVCSVIPGVIQWLQSQLGIGTPIGKCQIR